MPCKIIAIEGNIGAGKSTLINMLEEKYGAKYVYLREPVDVWEKIVDQETGENILQKFYKDPAKYAFSFQTTAYLTFYQQLIEAIRDNSDAIIICERSMDVSNAVFAKMLFEDGLIDSVNYQVLKMFYAQFTPIHLDAVIYLDVDIKTCKQRIDMRGRDGEQNISEEYLEKCEKYYEDWLKNQSTIIERFVYREPEKDITMEIDEFIQNNIKNK